MLGGLVTVDTEMTVAKNGGGRQGTIQRRFWNYNYNRAGQLV